VKLNALFMKQAGYSDEHVKAMTAAFTAANPNITVNVESVPYEALHDKIVAAAPAGTYDVVLVDVIWPAEFASKGLLDDLTAKIPAGWKTEVLPSEFRCIPG
jgi:multiple sugar transport system substrate-binding protein